MNYALVGTGRMGRAIELEAERRGHRCLAGMGESAWRKALAASGRLSRLEGADVVFEFTTPGAAESNVVALLDAGLPVVCGTTGWTPGDALESALERSPAGLVLAPNFSVGMNLFYRVVRNAAEMLGATGLYHPWVVEAHHRHKRDLPSGTARRLGEILVEHDPTVETLQTGDTSDGLAAHEVHVTGVRRGREPGTHTVGYDGEHDVITLRHRARSRAAFALGAVLAGEWIVGRRGRHDFDDVLDHRLARKGDSS